MKLSRAYRRRIIAIDFFPHGEHLLLISKEGESHVAHTNCELLRIEVPLMQAAIWPATAPELVAAVLEAGGLGSIGSIFEPAESLERQIARVRELTGRPFAVKYVVPLLDEEALA